MDAAIAEFQKHLCRQAGEDGGRLTHPPLHSRLWPKPASPGQTPQVDPQHPQDHADHGDDLHRAVQARHGSRLAATAYTRRITALVGHLPRGLEVTHPLLGPRPEPRGRCCWSCRPIADCAAATMPASCGRPRPAYRAAKDRARDAAGSLWQTGHLGLPFSQDCDGRAVHAFRGPALVRRSRVAGQPLPRGVPSGQIDRLDVAYTKFESLSRQYATVETLLPLSGLAGEEEESDSVPSRNTTSSPRPRAFSTRSCP